MLCGHVLLLHFGQWALFSDEVQALSVHFRFYRRRILSDWKCEHISLNCNYYQNCTQYTHTRSHTCICVCTNACMHVSVCTIHVMYKLVIDIDCNTNVAILNAPYVYIACLSDHVTSFSTGQAIHQDSCVIRHISTKRANIVLLNLRLARIILRCRISMRCSPDVYLLITDTRLLLQQQ